MPSNHTTPAASTAVVMAFSAIKVCGTVQEVTDVVAPILSQKLLLDGKHVTDMTAQLGICFGKVGVVKESSLSLMTERAMWPSAKEFATTEQPLDLITIPVVLALSEIARYAGQVLDSENFLTPGGTYKSLSNWAKALDNPGRNDACGSYSSTTQGSQQATGKIPAFDVKPFTGESLGGDVYISRVESIFASHGVSPFLVDMHYCLAHSALSGVFASRIRQSIAESPILGYITSEREAETICALVWSKIVTRLTATNLRIGRVLGYWQAFFKLSCEDKDQFFSFYSKAKKLIHKLKTAQSKAVKDEHFLRAFFSRAINVSELSEVTKKFLTMFNLTAEEIIDLVHTDFSAVHTKELLEDGSVTGGGLKSNLRRANNSNDKSKVNFTNGKSKPVTKVVFRAFPKKNHK